ncbi:hypothetical protein [Methanobacterium sp.]|uniref:hypothetical protein n=1 Tax=Methanobacterium sp. TaxID=2164 RepID=UPI001DE1205B|nr:hypothetical protein [Methanobacterium sp.]MBI4813994.1 hypothetical protein [Methanobacterium sp.]MBI5460100.1 hypothetical protein [Methanobacterium sp.]MDY9924069.1 hypothetical protein [Methanobacterium sp.]
MSRAVKIILFLIFFAVFFEAGLFASYTIVTQQPPNPADLIEMQINGVSSLLNLGPKIATQKNLVILNENEVVDAMKAKTGIDGINLQSLSAQTYQDTDDETINVNITAMGYKDSQTGGTTGNASSGPIVIKSNETYSITATAVATPKTGGVQIDLNSIVITSTRVLYNT